MSGGAPDRFKLPPQAAHSFRIPHSEFLIFLGLTIPARYTILKQNIVTCEEGKQYPAGSGQERERLV